MRIQNICHEPWVTALLAAVSSQQWTFIIWNYNSSIFRLCVRDGSCFHLFKGLKYLNTIDGIVVSDHHQLLRCCWAGRCPSSLSPWVSPSSHSRLGLRSQQKVMTPFVQCTTCNVPPLPPITIYSEWSLKLYLISLLTCNLIPTHWIGALLVSRISLTRRSDNSRKISIEVCLCDPWCSLSTETAIYRQVKWRRWRVVNIFVKSTDLHNW